MKTRNQNLVVGDIVNLKLYSRNSNNFADLYNIDHIDIFLEQCDEKCSEPHKHETLIQTIPGSSIEKCCTGIYHIDLDTSVPGYQIGRFHDVWAVQFEQDQPLSPYRQDFQLNSDLWMLSGTPVIYSFDFRFTPNRIRQGSKKHLIIQIIPNVPRATDLFKYYENVALSADLRINIEQACGNCLPAESDLRLIVDNEPVLDRDKLFNYYFLNTCDLELGIYNIWMELCFAGSVEVGQKMQLQIY